MRFRLRTLLIVLLLAPPVIAIYVTAMLAARDVARGRALLEAERATFEKERAAQRASLPKGYGTTQKLPDPFSVNVDGIEYLPVTPRSSALP
jgi:hypothetical protein